MPWQPLRLLGCRPPGGLDIELPVLLFALHFPARQHPTPPTPPRNTSPAWQRPCSLPLQSGKAAGELWQSHGKPALERGLTLAKVSGRKS